MIPLYYYYLRSFSCSSTARRIQPRPASQTAQEKKKNPLETELITARRSDGSGARRCLVSNVFVVFGCLCFCFYVCLDYLLLFGFESLATYLPTYFHPVLPGEGEGELVFVASLFIFDVVHTLHAALYPRGMGMGVVCLSWFCWTLTLTSTLTLLEGRGLKGRGGGGFVGTSARGLRYLSYFNCNTLDCGLWIGFGLRILGSLVLLGGCCVLCAVCCVLCAVCCVLLVWYLFVVLCYVLCAMLCAMPCAMCCLWCAAYFSSFTPVVGSS
ncbi:hypothetical protein F4861DRAFT_102585 [Xylaria intraflava]|nr:hypothetical protein F4861DRAFT_102585 [Xylaria intraflava]